MNRERFKQIKKRIGESGFWKPDAYTFRNFCDELIDALDEVELPDEAKWRVYYDVYFDKIVLLAPEDKPYNYYTFLGYL